jgi:hypothetical protein
MILIVSSLSRALFGRLLGRKNLRYRPRLHGASGGPPQVKTPPSKTPLYSPRKIAIEFGRKQVFARSGAPQQQKGKSPWQRSD